MSRAGWWQHYLRQTREDFCAAIVHFKRAVELDPRYGRAYAALAATYWEASRRYWAWRWGSDSSTRRSSRRSGIWPRPWPIRRAIAADPNDANGYIALAHALSFAGPPRSEALEQVERAIPHYPSSYLYESSLAGAGCA